MQAVILVGGEGTRLRPLTSTMPKPVVPLVDRPFIAHMLQWLAGHGVDDVVMSLGFLADHVRDVLGDGSRFGVTLHYVEEPQPRGTAGALKYAQELLDERFLMLNGDVLTDLDLTAQLARHAATGATATLALVPVEDTSAYGLVRCAGDGAVLEFIEKPPPGAQLDTNLISAGAYVLERSVLDLIAPDRAVSIEREIWPALVGAGMYGFAHPGAYWLDIGTPERYLQGTFDILTGDVHTAVSLDEDRCSVGDGAVIDGRLVAPAIVGRGAVIAAGAEVGPLVVLGDGVRVEAGARIERAVVLDGVQIGAGARLADCIVAAGASIGARTVVSGGAVIGEDATIGADNIVGHDARVDPGATLPDRVPSPE